MYDFIRKYQKPIRYYSLEYGGPLPSVAMAQMILESNYGKSTLAKAHNNFFGIKATADWKGKTATLSTAEHLGGWTTQQAVFRKYQNPEDSIKDYYRLINEKYPTLRQLTTPQQQARAIHQGGYATDPGYEGKLIQVIQRENLGKIDEKMMTDRNIVIIATALFMIGSALTLYKYLR